jgi:hypothetical protein
MVRNDFENTCSAKAAERLRIFVLLSGLRRVQGNAN